MKVIVTGSLAFDNIFDFPGKFGDHILPEKIHAINLSFLVKTMKKQRGGTAGNIAYNLALLGVNPTILAAAGNDFADYKNFLKKSGVDTSMIRIARNEPTASAFIFTDMADNQITGFYPGAMNYVSKLSISGALRSARKFLCGTKGSFLKNFVPPRAPFVVIAPNEPGAMIKFVKECQKLGIPYLFDPGMQLPRLSAKDLAQGVNGAKILIGNDYEMALIAKILRYKDIRILGEKNKDKTLITTLGEKGSIVEANGKTYKIPPAKPKEVLDPTGAGDAYRAGFLAGYLRGLPLPVCGRMGSVAAVYTVEKYGTTTHKFTKMQFCQRYKQSFSANKQSFSANKENFGEELKW